MKKKRITDGHFWRCTACEAEYSLRLESFFSRSHLRIRDIIFIMYWWAEEHSQKSLRRELHMGNKTAIDWYSFCRDICINYNETHPVEIGGFDGNGESLIIEMDETVITKRKYHRGRLIKQRWLFGGVERHSGICFLKMVANRKADSLLPVIREHCLPGSLLLTDGFSSYMNLDTVYDGIYAHECVIHEENFVNPDNPLVHTQKIENLWSLIKRRNKIRKGTHLSVVKSYLHEFMWRKNFVRDRNPFVCLIVCILVKYMV
jgi:transposase-like protein